MRYPLFCSLIPSEFLSGLGARHELLTHDKLKGFVPCEYQCVFHENLCSYSKVLFEHISSATPAYDFVVIPASCDAMRKLYSALQEKLPREKLFYFDFPRGGDRLAVEFFAGELARLKEFVSSHPLGIDRESAAFNGSQLNTAEMTAGADITLPEEAAKGVGVIGSNVDQTAISKAAELFGVKLVGISRCIDRAAPDAAIMKMVSSKASLKELAAAYIDSNRCPRSFRPQRPKDIASDVKKSGVSALIISTLKFCDFYPFDLVELGRELKDMPVLMLEHDLTSTDEGQIMTRLGAFFESVFRGRPRGPSKKPVAGFFAGVDSGSHATKVVIVDGSGRSVAEAVVATGTSVKKSAEEALKKAMNDSEISRRDISRIVATGYGRANIDFADERVTEITCHALGAHARLGHKVTIIDIGGQDSKAIRVASDGSVEKFAMNDKCAAGTGRFLEVIADRLEMSLSEFAQIAGRAKKATPVSSMCSVFAESEVISLIASGQPKEAIAKGIHEAIALRTVSLVRRIDGAEPFYMTGGVAKNLALVEELSKGLNAELKVVTNPQTVGAHGAAIFASRI